MLDLIRIRNRVRSNHAAAILSLIKARHANIDIKRAKVGDAGRETPLATLETIRKILAHCPKPEGGADDEALLASVRARLERRPKPKDGVSRKARSGHGFGSLDKMIRKIR